MHVAAIDAPGDQMRIVGASAGEGRHPPMIPLICGRGKPLHIGARERRGYCALRSLPKSEKLGFCL
jgi:hypothetical protein